jgi:hypothetical protein
MADGNEAGAEQPTDDAAKVESTVPTAPEIVAKTFRSYLVLVGSMAWKRRREFIVLGLLLPLAGTLWTIYLEFKHGTLKRADFGDTVMSTIQPVLIIVIGTLLLEFALGAYRLHREQQTSIDTKQTLLDQTAAEVTALRDQLATRLLPPSSHDRPLTAVERLRISQEREAEAQATLILGMRAAAGVDAMWGITTPPAPPERLTHNITVVMPQVRPVYFVAALNRFVTTHQATNSDEPYMALVVGFRNEAPTLPEAVKNVRARLEFDLTNEMNYPLTGYWLGTTVDHTYLEPGAASQEVIIATYDGDYTVRVIDDRRGPTGMGVIDRHIIAGPRINSPETFDVAIVLSSDGQVLIKCAVRITYRPPEISGVLIPQPAES